VAEWQELVKTGEILSNAEVTDLYKKIPGHWVLLLPMGYDKKKIANRLKILKFDRDKEILRDFLMDQEDWEDAASLIYFFTGYDGTCKI
jgi:hypothetical protein